MVFLRFFAFAMLLPLAVSLAAQAAEALSPPVAEKQPRVMTKFGDRRVDDYYWLREKDDPRVTAYLEAENRYTEAATKPLEAFRGNLYKEILGRIKETDESVPYRKHGFWSNPREA